MIERQSKLSRITLPHDADTQKLRLTRRLNSTALCRDGVESTLQCCALSRRCGVDSTLPCPAEKVSISYTKAALKDSVGRLNDLASPALPLPAFLRLILDCAEIPVAMF